MDTLAGITIKYGVEIPLPGRHPPSPAMSNGSTHSGEKTRRHQSHDIADSVRPLKPKPSPRRLSSAMCSLQGYCGLTQSNKSSRLPEGTEMSVFKSGKTLTFEEDTHFLESPASNPLHSLHQKTTRCSANGFSPENGDLSENTNELDGPIRRRQKPDADHPLSHTPEILLKEEGAGGAFSGRAAGKGLALRPKLGSRTDLDDGSASAGDSVIGEAPLSVRKSSSASNLSEPQSISSIWPTSKWSLKPDVIARPIFDGFQKPRSAWRNKVALDYPLFFWTFL